MDETESELVIENNNKVKDFLKEYKYEILLSIIILGAIIYKLWNNSYFLNLFKRNGNIVSDKVRYIIDHSLMVHLEDDKLSERRFEEVTEIYNKYKLPIHKFRALHWKKDKKELLTLSLDYKGITENNKRPGAYGLAGSFYKCLLKAYAENWSYLLFLEDDAVPILEPNEFYSRFNEVIETLPDNGDGIYNLGFHVYCRTNKNDITRWFKTNNNNSVTGTHSMLISNNYIKLLTEYIQKNNIDLAIDHFINKFNPWIWYGDLSENGMFRGLYKQLNINCSNFHTLPGAINKNIL